MSLVAALALLLVHLGCMVILLACQGAAAVVSGVGGRGMVLV